MNIKPQAVRRLLWLFLTGPAAATFHANADGDPALVAVAAAPQASTEVAANESDRVGEQDAADAVKLDPVTVSGTRGKSYRRENSATATKTDTPLIELPVTVQAVGAAVIEDQKVARVRDALENISGVRPNPSISSGNSFIIRGFADARRLFVNGLSANTAGLRTELDTAVVEQVEVLKGPASVLYGRAEPGGVINIVTKKPLDKAACSLEQQFGSFDLFRTIGDATGPITEDGSLLYRFVGVYQKSDTFRDFSKSDRYVLAPSLTWKITDSTTFDVRLTHLSQDYIADFGIPVVGTRPAPIPISRSFGDPNDTVDTYRRTEIGTELSHHFNDDWTVRHRFLYVDDHAKDDFVNPAPAFGNAFQADGRTLNRNIFFQDFDTHDFVTNLDLIARLRHGSFEHEVLFGGDYTVADDNTYATFGNFNTGNPDLAIDIYNPFPSYGIDRSVFEQARQTPTGPTNVSRFLNEFYGFYLQDHVQIGEQLHLLFGGRYDKAKVGRGRGATVDAAENALNNSTPSVIRSDEAFSPRVGALYQLTPVLGSYASYTRSFGGNNGINADGSPQPPQRGEQFEVGLKAQLLDNRVLATVAVFNLERQNQLTPDLSTADPNDSIAVGVSRSRGVEVDVSGELSRDLSLIASYAYTDAKVTQDNRVDANGNPTLEGRALVNVPYNSASLSLRYDLPANTLPGLSLGLGAFAVGNREGDANNTFDLPGYLRIDSSAAYRLRAAGYLWTVQLNVRNLLDQTYYESSDPNSNVGPRNGVYPGAPRTFIGSLRVEL